MSLEDRIRRLEQQFALLDVPSLNDVRAAFERTTERALARFRGESEPYEDRRREDRDAIERWAQAGGVDLEGEAERAREKLRNAGRTTR
jgi:hypothetical protein